MSEYPEHDKLEKIHDQSQEIGEFVEWLLSGNSGYFICTQCDSESLFGPIKTYLPTSINIQEVLAKYYEIDLIKLEKEKREMLDELRKKNKGAK